jgi:hypothetical protein
VRRSISVAASATVVAVTGSFGSTGAPFTSRRGSTSAAAFTRARASLRGIRAIACTKFYCAAISPPDGHTAGFGFGDDREHLRPGGMHLGFQRANSVRFVTGSAGKWKNLGKRRGRWRNQAVSRPGLPFQINAVGNSTVAAGTHVHYQELIHAIPAVPMSVSAFGRSDRRRGARPS